MTDNAAYMRLPDDAREDVRAAAHAQAVKAAEHYAGLLAAEAGIAARAVLPEVERLVFQLTDDYIGESATLIAAYAADGRQLWHVDDGEWPDESIVTDFLETAVHRRKGYFAKSDEGDDMFVLVLDT